MHVCQALSCMTMRIIFRILSRMDGYGRLIERARIAEGLSKVALAAALGVDPTMVGKLEREEVNVSPQVYQRLVSGILTTLRPVDLLNAMGYPVTVQGADRLPVALVRDLLRLDADELRAIAVLARRQSRQALAPLAEARK